MDELELIKNVLENNDKPLLARQISSQIFHRFDGYIISKREIAKILWGELKNFVYYDKINYTYQLRTKKLDKKLETSIDNRLFLHIKDSLKYIESREKISVAKIAYILKNQMNIDYNLKDIRRVFNKFDIDIIEEYDKIPRRDNIEKIDLSNSRSNATIGRISTERDQNTLIIDNDIYSIKIEKLPFHPLFSQNYDPILGLYHIVINESHNLYDHNSIELIKKMAVSIIHAKLSMTGKESDIFMNRINHYLNIIQ